MTLDQLRKILEHRRKVDKIFRDAEKVGVIDINGPLFDTVWHAIEAITCVVDPYDWIGWFIYDNDYGVKELKATVNNKIFKVKSAKDLLAVIKESEKL
jgi:hypothetical protein